MQRVLVALGVAVLWVGGCGSSPASDCLSEGGAEVCLTVNGGVQISSEGLEPGSDLTIRVVDGPSQTVKADETGSTGTVGFLTAVEPDSATVDVTGTAKGGEPVSGTLTVG